MIRKSCTPSFQRLIQSAHHPPLRPIETRAVNRMENERHFRISRRQPPENSCLAAVRVYDVGLDLLDEPPQLAARPQIFERSNRPPQAPRDIYGESLLFCLVEH